MRLPFSRSLALVILLAGVSAAVPSFADDRQDTRPRANDTQLRHALERIRLRHGVPGMSAVIFDRETVRGFAVGELGDDAGPVTPGSRFRLGQSSMMFTGMVVAALQADGSLSVDSELRRVVPEIDLQNPWSTERPVRISDLLSHRAGLGALHFRDVHAEHADQPLLAGINRAWHELRLEFRPGDREQYSVIGYAIAAYLVEKAVDMSFSRVLDRMLFQPLESGASLGRADGERNGDSRGHSGWPARAAATLPLNFPQAGDIWMSAEDLGRVGRMLLNRGEHGERIVLAPQAIDWLHQPADPATALVPGSRHGVHAEEHGGRIHFTQTGALPGFLSRFVYSPELGRGYAVLLNHDGAHRALADADVLLRGQIKGDGRLAPPEAASEPRAGLAGWYRNVWPELPPRRLYQRWLGLAYAWECGNRLCLRGMGQGPVELEAVDEHRLREWGRWHPSWQTSETETGYRLETASSAWQPVQSWQVAAMLLAVALVLAGLLTGIAMTPVWIAALLRKRSTDYHALVPRLLPLLAVWSVLLVQLMLFITDYPALGEPGNASYAILVLTILAPVVAVLALLAAVAGFVWQQSRRDMIVATLLALAATAAVLMMADADLVAFSTWKY